MESMESQGIKFEVRENIDNLEKLGNNCVFKERFHIVIAFLYMCQSIYLVHRKLLEKCEKVREF